MVVRSQGAQPGAQPPSTGAQPPAPPSRRWPPVVALVTGFLMVFLALPNPLRVPSNNPNTTAEIAPVPGTSEDQQGNFAETGLARSPGLGAGDNTGLGLGLGQLPPGREVPVDKECVGDPPRQTEDLLSPPCVPYFSGKNGGATYRGVTGNEVRVVMYNPFGVEGDMSTPYRPEDEGGSQADEFQVNLVKTIKYQLRYFQRRYQTYGRLVHVYAQPTSGSTPEAQRTDAVVSRSVYDPFAAAMFVITGGEYSSKLAEYGVPSFGQHFSVPQRYFDQNASYVFSFPSEQETEADYSASFVCRVLRPRRLPARFSTDPVVAIQTRKVGFIYRGDDPAGRQPEIAPKFLKVYRDQCGFAPDLTRTYRGAGGERDATRIIAEMKTEGITTLVCWCTPGDIESARVFLAAATSAGYFPEWYWDAESIMDRPVWQQAYGAKEQASFGTYFYWRAPAFRQQVHYQSYANETRDGSVPNVLLNFNIYTTFLNLFTAIQAAGPTLTPETVERGMFTFGYRSPSNPWVPTGGYGPSGIGTYTFLDTALGFWWDPTGTPPGGTPKEGCQRLMNQGRRYGGPAAVAAGQAPPWPLGDELLAEAKRDGPCNEDIRKVRDAKPGDIT